MKICIAISSLLVISFAILGTEAFYSYTDEAWMEERKSFKTGYKMMDDQGELREVTLAESGALPSGRTFGGAVKFHLYTNQSRYLEFELHDDFSKLSDWYDTTAPTVFITHGWINSASSHSCTLIRNAFRVRGGFNVIVVDWSSISYNLYEIAAVQVRDVGLIVGDVIKKLSSNEYLKIEDTFLVGHSLGAHVMGIAGAACRGAPKAVFGLDPALPLFSFYPDGWGLSKKSGKYVEVIHTNAGFLGANDVLGHADFFVNGGIHQSGCGADLGYACSHARAYELYAESINTKRDFWGYKCTDVLVFFFDSCYSKWLTSMGGVEIDNTIRGVFTVETNSMYPFAKAS